MRVNHDASRGGVLSDVAHRESVDRVVIVMQRQTDLLQMIPALRATGGFTGLLHGRQQSNHDCDDRNHHQKFDEG